MNLKFIIPILFLSCTSIQKNNDVCNDQRTPANQAQCANLFSDTNSNLKVSTINPSKNTKTRISEMTDAEILNYIEALVIERIKIDTGFYAASDNQKKQANEYFAKDINEIINKDQKYLTVYRTKLNEKSKDYRATSKNKDKEKRERDEEKRRIIEDSLDPINQAKQKIIFHEIKPGKFMMGEVGQQVEKEIKESFSIMSTQFTQMMWSRLKIAMGETGINKINPSQNKTGTDSIKINIEGLDVQMKPDHQKGDEYDLPTSEQWEFVMRDRGNANNIYFDKADDSELSKYAWYYKNSDDQTHAVAQKLPRMIEIGDGIRQPFYDMEGNVWEWNKSVYDSTGAVRVSVAEVSIAMLLSCGRVFALGVGRAFGASFWGSVLRGLAGSTWLFFKA